MKMKKLLTAAAAFITISACAQPDGRTFSIVNSPYTELENPTVITTSGWDDFTATVPLGFDFTIFGQTVNEIKFDADWTYGGEFIVSTSVTSNMNMISSGFDLIDREDAGNPSTVSYKIEGTSPNRIAKIQWKNTGLLWDEIGNDSLNFQAWFYETSNRFELHFGESHIENLFDASDWGYTGLYFYKDLTEMGPDYFYYVSSVSPARVDSMNHQEFMDNEEPRGITNHPAAGTVFRFDIPSTGVKTVGNLTSYINVYPTVATNTCYIELNKDNLNATATLLDMRGRALKTEKLHSGKNDISLEHIAAGNYLLKITSGSENMVYKIIKQ